VTEPLEAPGAHGVQRGQWHAFAELSNAAVLSTLSASASGKRYELKKPAQKNSSRGMRIGRGRWLRT